MPSDVVNRMGAGAERPPGRTGNEHAAESVWRYVPSLALVRGFASTLVLSTSATLFKNLGLSNAAIGYLSILTLPASLKFLWAPWADSHGTKRQWALGAGFGLGFSLLLLSTVLLVARTGLPWVVCAYALTAVFYAVSDFANDGFFVCAVAPAGRPTAVALLTAFARISTVAVSGVIFIAGVFSDRFHSFRIGWMIGLAVMGGVVLMISGLNTWVFPHPAADRPARAAGGETVWREALASYLDNPGFWVVTAFLFLFRFGESIVMRMANVFLVEGRSTGGLAMTLQQVSLTGAVGVSAMIAGGVLSGAVIKKFGVRKTRIPLSLGMLVPNVLYLGLAWFPSYDGIDLPVGAGHWHLSQRSLVMLVSAAESLGYGLGYTFYFSVSMALARGKFRATHMAFSNAVMLLGYIMPTIIGGDLEQRFGWTGLFSLTSMLGIPGFALTLLLPQLILDRAAGRVE